MLAYIAITRNSAFGRQVTANGGHLDAAQLSGVNVEEVDFWIFVALRHWRRRDGRPAIDGGPIMAAVSNGMQLLDLDQSIQSAVRGHILLLAVASDVYT